MNKRSYYYTTLLPRIESVLAGHATAAEICAVIAELKKAFAGADGQVVECEKAAKGESSADVAGDWRAEAAARRSEADRYRADLRNIMSKS